MFIKRKMDLIISLAAACLIYCSYQPRSLACTRILVTDKEHSVMMGRSMDWEEDMKTNLLVLPRHLPHSGGEAEGTTQGNWITWESKYGSIVATGYEHFITDGLNEKGLGVHLLWHEGADYGKRDPKKPSLSLALWLIYYLDNFESVSEAVHYTQKNPLQITPFYHEETKQWGKLHLVLDDASGDSAVFEYINGHLVIYHGEEFTTVTNEPDYNVHLQNIKQYRGFGGNKPLPGKFSSKNRFVRASFYAKVVPAFVSNMDRVIEILAILNNVAYPYTTIDETKSIWRTVCDLTNKIYYFQASKNQNLIFVNLKQFDLNIPAIRMLDLVNHPEYVGDVSDKFETIS